MSSKSKGQRREREARELYEQAGYEVQPFRGTRYEEKDGFELFDFVAIADGYPRFVQVKANQLRNASGFFEECVDRFGGARIHADLVVCYDREGWRLLDPVHGPDRNPEPKTFVDERELDVSMGDGLAWYLGWENHRVDG